MIDVRSKSVLEESEWNYLQSEMEFTMGFMFIRPIELRNQEMVKKRQILKHVICFL